MSNIFQIHFKDNIADVEVTSEKSIVEQVMENIDSLHARENIILENLFVTAFDNAETFEVAKEMSEKDLLGRIAKYQKKRTKYFQKWVEEEMPEHLIVTNVTDQMELMAKVTILKLVADMKANQSTAEDAQIELISQLKTRQALELRFVYHFGPIKASL